MNKFIYNHLAKTWLKKDGAVLWFYSDPHFGDFDLFLSRADIHPIIKNMEGEQFYVQVDNPGKLLSKDDVLEMLREFDEQQVKNINSSVGKNGAIIILGDIGDLSYVKKIKGYKILLMGNHDEGNASKYERVVTAIETFNSEDIPEEERQRIAANAERIMRDPKLLDELEVTKYFRQKTEDNHLFDEVYEGPLMISDRIILSHEPLENLQSFLYNIHGHDHSGSSKERHYNMCAEKIKYKPVSLISIVKSGALADIESIHRITIDVATVRKATRKARK